MKTFGQHLALAVRGASHSRRISFSLENFPAGFLPDYKALSAFMARRAPGRGPLATARRESDAISFFSGFGSDGATDGSVIRGEIANRDMRPGDYGSERTVPRPGHADFGQWVESGAIPTGGGKNSGRLTAPLCAAGGLCLQWLERRGVSVSARVDSIAGKKSGFKTSILKARDDGDSVGGTVVCEIKGLPPGIGGALFDGIESGLSAAMFAIPGVKGIEFGEGFRSTLLRGSENDDPFVVQPGGRVATSSNRHGGLLGGRTSGMPVVFRLAMKPTPTVFKPLSSVDLKTMTPAVCGMKGRHDPCIALRAVPVVEALAGFVFADLLLADEASRPRVCLTLTGRTLGENLRQFESQRYFTDMVELRADLLSKRERAAASKFPSMVPVPVVLTFRRAADGGAFEGHDSERASFFSKVLGNQASSREGGRGFAYVDFEEGFGSPDLLRLAREAGVKVVRSVHDFTGPVPGIVSRVKSLLRHGDVAKIAFKPRTLDDVTRLFAKFRSDSPVRRLPYVVMAMGAGGFPTRALAGRLGSLWTYSSVSSLSSLGHVTPYELVRTYRFRSTGADADLYGVTGWPLKATRSPEINNAAFSSEDRDAVMVPVPAESPAAAIRFMDTLGLKGMAVTIPHKRGVMPLLDRIHPFARKVGAVNTVVREKGALVGYNTDVSGIAQALKGFAGDLSGRTVALLGDGGAAQAVKVALKLLGARFKVFHRRTPPQGFDLIVNATPVNPIPDYEFTGRELVYDLVYVPETTPLMEAAMKSGCRVENGFSMLVAQALEQRRLYDAADGETP